MRKMMAMVGAASVLAATPGIAQYRGQQDRYVDRYEEPRGGAQADFGQRITILSNRIQVGIQTGAITRTEAAPLREQLRQIQQLERRLAPGGLTQAERVQILPRIQSLRQQIAGAERNDYQRPRTSDDDVWGYQPDERSSDRDTRDRYDRDERDRDDRDIGRDGRRGYDDGVGFDNRDQVRVGGRVPANLGGVSYELRSRYPETERYTYRSDGRRVYQVERRTGVIVRIYEAERY